MPKASFWAGTQNMAKKRKEHKVNSSFSGIQEISLASCRLKKCC
jgi:hypothetical protein